MEVESALVSEPGKLKERIYQVSLVREALADELNGTGHSQNNGALPTITRTRTKTYPRQTAISVKFGKAAGASVST